MNQLLQKPVNKCICAKDRLKELYRAYIYNRIIGLITQLKEKLKSVKQITLHICVCARDRPKRGCKKHITMVKIEINLITYGNWEII